MAKPTQTPWDEQVTQIEALLNDPSIRVDYFVGPDPLACTQNKNQIRRVIFEFGDGTPSQATNKGSVMIDAATPGTETFADTRTGLDLEVRAHILSERSDISWILVGNVIEASIQSLEKNSIMTGFEIVPDVHDTNSYEFGGGSHMIVSFTWKMHLFKGITALPACEIPIDDYLKTERMGTVLSTTHTGVIGTPP